MDGSSGFHAVRSSTSRSPYRFLHEQRHQFGSGACHLLHTHNLIARSAGISIKREKIADTIFMPEGVFAIPNQVGIAKLPLET